MLLSLIWIIFSLGPLGSLPDGALVKGDGYEHLRRQPFFQHD